MDEKYQQITSFIPNNISPIIPAKTSKYYRNSITVSLGKSISKELMSKKGEEM